MYENYHRTHDAQKNIVINFCGVTEFENHMPKNEILWHLCEHIGIWLNSFLYPSLRLLSLMYSSVRYLKFWETSFKVPESFAAILWGIRVWSLPPWKQQERIHKTPLCAQIIKHLHFYSDFPHFTILVLNWRFIRGKWNIKQNLDEDKWKFWKAFLEENFLKKTFQKITDTLKMLPGLG